MLKITSFWELLHINSVFELKLGILNLQPTYGLDFWEWNSVAFEVWASLQKLIQPWL